MVTSCCRFPPLKPRWSRQGIDAWLHRVLLPATRWTTKLTGGTQASARERGRREVRGAAGSAHTGEEKGRGEGEEEEMGCYCGPSERERERLSPSGFSIFLSLFYFPDYIYAYVYMI